MPKKLPVFLFAFSNDADKSLRLREELNDCRAALAGLAQKNKITFVAAEFPTLEDIYDRFDRANDQIYFFHFSGHSDAVGLQLSDTVGKSESLATILGQQKRLKLAFLNGCANAAQVRVLWDKGVQTVIATSAKISDQRARILSRRFYRSLAGGQTIRESFEAAVSYVRNDQELETEFIYRGQGLEVTDAFPWGLYVQDSGYLDWHIGLIDEVENREALAELKDRSRERYNEFTSKGGRYGYLSIDRAILSGITTEAVLQQNDLITSRIGEERQGLYFSLSQLWSEPCPHALLIGAGGMGKTVSLIQLWQQMLLEMKSPAPIPIFIPLNEFNNRPVSGFIRKYILEHYDFSDFDQLAKAPLKIEDQADRPHLLLLLDGMNEVKGDLRNLLLEINELRTGDNYPGLQIVLTSRTDLRAMYQWHDFHYLELKPLTDEQIESFLAKPLPDNGRLADLLRNPMMLTLYGAQSALPARYVKRKLLLETLSSTGEMLFNVEMTQRIKIEEHFAAQAEEQARSRFVLEHLLPFIAWKMQQSERYFIGRKDDQIAGLQTILKEGLESLLSDDFYETFDYFCEFLEPEYFKLPLPKLFIQLLQRIAGDQLTILIRDGENYRFLHQNFRDYFAARHVQNQMEIALNTGRLPGILHGGPLDIYVRRLLGELEGEHTNQLVWQEPDGGWKWDHGHFKINNRLSRLLEKCRGVFDQDQIGYVVWNILAIQKEKRRELSGADLRDLNLKHISFNRVRMARERLRTDFSGALLDATNFFSSGHSTRVKTAVFSPDDRHLLSAAYDGTFKIWDAQTGQCLRTVEASSDGLFSAFYSPDGLRIVSSSFDGLMKIWNAGTGTLIRTLKAELREVKENSAVFGMLNSAQWVVYAGFSPDGALMVSAHGDQTARVWDPETGELLQEFNGGQGNLQWVCFSTGGDRIATAGQDGSVMIWNASDGRHLATLADLFGNRGLNRGCKCCEFSPDGQYLLATGGDGSLKIWDLAKQKVHLEISGGSGTLNTAFFSQDNRSIITASGDSKLRILDVETGFCRLTIPVNTFSSEFASFSQDGNRIATTGYDGDVFILDARTGQVLVSMDDSNSGTLGATFNQDESSIVCGSYADTISRWDVASGRCIFAHTGIPFEVSRIMPDHRGKQFLVGDRNGNIQLKTLPDGQLKFALDGHRGSVSDLTFSKDDRLILTAAADKNVRVWDAETGTCLRTLPHQTGVYTARFSFDERFIVTTSDTINIWENGKGGERPIKVLAYNGFSSRGMAILSPDNLTIACAARAGQVELWDLADETLKARIDAHPGGIFGLSFSHDGKRLVTTSGDKTAKVWNLDTMKCELVLKGHRHTVTDPTFTLDDHRIMTSSGDGTVRVWDAGTGACLMVLPQMPGVMIQACKFLDLHPDAEISAETSALLRRMGGIMDKEDEGIWEGLAEKYFQGTKFL